MIKYPLFLFILIQYCNGLAQFNRNNFSFNIGGQMTNTLTKPYYTYQYDEGGVVTKQRGALFSDFNCMFKQQIKKSKISTLIGFGLSHKGYRELGQAYEIYGYGGYYNDKVWNEYLPMFLGINYNLKGIKKMHLSVSQLFVYEYNTFWVNSNLKKYGYSTRTNLTATYSLKNRRNLLITSYFQTAIVKYNKTKSYTYSSDYWPYSYGINIGITLKNKKGK